MKVYRASRPNIVEGVCAGCGLRFPKDAPKHWRWCADCCIEFGIDSPFGPRDLERCKASEFYWQVEELAEAAAFRDYVRKRVNDLTNGVSDDPDVSIEELLPVVLRELELASEDCTLLLASWEPTEGEDDQ